MSVETEKPVMEQNANQAEPPKEEFVYRYQPKDAEGRPLGGEQVIKANNMQEALDKMANQNQELIRLNRKMKQERALGVQEEAVDQIPADAEREEELDFEPKTLSPAEKIQLAYEMSDPEKLEEVAEKIVEIGLRKNKTFKQTAADAATMRAHAEATAFREAHPEFHPTQDNVRLLVGMTQKAGLRPTKKNFELIFKRAQEAGLLQEAPNVAEDNPTETQSGDGSGSRITAPETSQQKRTPVPTSSGLKGSGSPSGNTPRPKQYSKSEIDRMSKEEYREKVLIPEMKRLKAAGKL
jgi:hypothetical protein